MSNSPLVLVTCATGKTGNIGGHVAHALQRRGGFRIRIGARDVGKASSMFKESIPDATYVHLDLSDPSTFAGALAGVDAVFLGHPEHGPFDEKGLQQAFMDAVSAVEPLRPHVVKFTTAFSAEYVKPFEEHGPLLADALKNIQQVVADFKAKHGEKSVTVVEGAAWFYQSYTSQYKDMLSGGCLMTASADAALPRIDSRDIATAIAAVLADTDTHGGRVVTLTGGQRLRESKVLQVLAKIAGKDVAYSPDPSPLQDFLQDIPVSDGVSLWDGMNALWSVEKHWGGEDGEAVALKPEVFEELTGQKYRTWAAFVEENKHAWDAVTMPAQQSEGL